VKHISRCGPSRNAIPPLLSVYDGTRCVGHLLNRGRCGWESFDAGDVSCGLFPTMQEARDALPEVRP